MILIGHMANLRSFGVPYLSPIGPLSARDMKDVLIRAPWWQMEKRPEFMAVQDNSYGHKLPQQIKQDGGLDGSNIHHEHKASKEGNQMIHPRRLFGLCDDFSFPTFLTGCWDRTETNDIAFVLTSSVDLEDDGRYRVTYMLPLPGSMGGASGGGGGTAGGKSYYIDSEVGTTIRDAISKLQIRMARRCSSPIGGRSSLVKSWPRRHRYSYSMLSRVHLRVG